MQTLPTFEADSPAQAPTHLGPYRIRERIGEGGGGVVFRAEGPDGEDVAIKTILRPTEHGIAGLRSEVHALGRITHAGVVRVLGSGVADGRPWFAMERLIGETLADHFRKLGTRRAWTTESLAPQLRYLVALCEPLSVIHAAGIVHRDLKPQNVFVRPNGELVLFDFGIARARPSETRAEASIVPRAGTLAYMAPEQLTGELVDARTDLYALGCILFELLVGRPPEGDEGKKPSSIVGGVPAELDELTVALLHPRPRLRVGHASDVADWLRAVLGEDSAPSASTLPLCRPVLSGRADVLETLEASMRTDRGAFVILEGESGIGKTHIAAEAARRLRFSSLVVSAACAANDTSTRPLGCFSALFDLAVDRVIAEPTSPLASVVTANLVTLIAVHRAFARLPHRPGPIAAPTVEEVHVAVRALVAALASDSGSLVLLLDDLQWIDELSLEVVRAMVGGWLGRHRVVLLATCRTDGIEPAVVDLLTSASARRIPLGPLPESDLHELLTDMLGVSEPPASVLRWVSQRAEGNPFLAAEYLRLVVDEMTFERELVLPRIRVRLREPERLDALPTPASVHELVGRRIDDLEPAALAVAEILAVLGGSLDEVVAAAFSDDESVRDGLAVLRQRQLVDDDGGRLRLSHDRLRAVIHDRVPAYRRRELHGRAADLLLPLAEPRHAAIARHLREAGRLAEAIGHYDLAGAEALRQAAFGAAARLFDDALAVASELGSKVGTAGLARLRHGAARARFHRGEMHAFESHARETLRLGGIHLPSDRRRWARIATGETAKYLTGLGHRSSRDAELGDAQLGELTAVASLLPTRYFYEEDVVPAIATVFMSANLARRSGGSSKIATPMAMMGAAAELFHLPRLANRFFRDADHAATTHHDWPEATHAVLTESMSRGGAARWAESLEAADRADRYAADSRDPIVGGNILANRSHIEYFRGHFDEARALAERLAVVAEEGESEQQRIWALYLQARSDIRLGAAARARGLLEDARARLAKRPETISELATQGMLAEAYHLTDDEARAESLVTDLITRILPLTPSAYPSLIAYTSTANVTRRLLLTGATPERQARARAIGGALWRFAFLFPIAHSSACLHSASLLALAGWKRPAALLHKRGAKAAARTGTHHERPLFDEFI